MIFSSYIFLFRFLPAFLAVYYLLPERRRSAFILVASYVFYGWWRFDFLWLLAGVTVLTYAFARGLEKAADPRLRLAVLSAGVGTNLAALAYFKYANFGVAGMNAVLARLGERPLPWTPVLLPIGLSFFIFHAISYLVDIYRGEAEPSRDLIDFAAFIALFPHLIAGPVLRYHLLARQFRSREHSWDNFSRGAGRFMAGFSKKVLVADSISPLADAVFALRAPGMADAWLGVLAYTLQIFFDFSGYTDMAVGLALMIGFEFPENFDDPYVSRSITEFWRRWHMSLSSWLLEYLYIPLGGNRKGPRRTYFNLLATMVLGGLWHGANWTFVLWGAWHGGALAAERALGVKAPAEPPRPTAGVVRTMLVVIAGWVLFRAPDVRSAAAVYAGMLGAHGLALSDELAWRVNGLQLVTMAAAAALTYVPPFLPRVADAAGAARPARAAWIVAPLFLLSVLRLAAQSYSPFLYFQF